MRWFRGSTEVPRLLSLSPLRVDGENESEPLNFHVTSLSRDVSSLQWSRRNSSGSESERNCYNVQTSRVTTEKASNKKNKKKILEERRKSYEKRNPLLDKVKNTRLSFFKDKSFNDGREHSSKTQFRSMYDLEKLGLMRNDLRRSVCEMDLNEIIEEEKIQAKRKKRSKSHNRATLRKNLDVEFGILGFGSSIAHNTCQSKNDLLDLKAPIHNHGEHFLLDRAAREKPVNLVCRRQNDDLDEESTHFASAVSSSCFAMKFRAMQDRYFKSSTSRLIAKIYKRDGNDNENRRLRSFSYGTLPGLDELRTNPLFEDQYQDDSDSGILDNGSATSSLLDDRCSSGASGFIARSPLALPPKKLLSSLTEANKNDQGSLSCVSLFQETPSIVQKATQQILNRDSGGLRIDEENSDFQSSPHQAVNRDLIQQSGNEPVTLKGKFNDLTDFNSSTELPVVQSRGCKSDTIFVKLTRKSVDQSLGIFIAKTSEMSSGYLVAYVVPNGLADNEGTLRIGDEILIVNGKRLRGLDMAEAKMVVGCSSTPGDVDIVISRFIGVERPSIIKDKMKESSVDYENIHFDNSGGEIRKRKSHFKKHSTHRKYESNSSIILEKSKSIDEEKSVSNFCTLPRRRRSTVSTFHTVVFEKGPGKKSLGFTIVGGRDSPKGSIGIFIKSVLPGGQAAEDGRLRAGDEILAVNGQVSHDLTHREAVQLFRNIKNGPLALHLCRRIKQRDVETSKAKSCADLLLEIDSLTSPKL